MTVINRHYLVHELARIAPWVGESANRSAVRSLPPRERSAQTGPVGPQPNAGGMQRSTKEPVQLSELQSWIGER